MDEDIVLSFVRSAIKSAWSLELLLLLHREPGRVWTSEALVRELRGSESLVNAALATLSEASVIEIGEAGVHYHPRSREVDGIVTALVDLYGQKPITVLHTIFTAPSDRIRSFAEAFLFRKRSDQ